MSTQEQIESIYIQLESLLHGLGNPISGLSTIGGPLNQYLEAVKSLSNITGQKLDQFVPRNRERLGDPMCSTRDLVAEISGLLGWIRGNYLKGRAPHFQSVMPPANQINVSQGVNVSQIVSLDIAELLNQKERDFEEGSAERNFIEKVKMGLKTAANVASIIALIIETAKEFGISQDQLVKIFS